MHQKKNNILHALEERYLLLSCRNLLPGAKEGASWSRSPEAVPHIYENRISHADHTPGELENVRLLSERKMVWLLSASQSVAKNSLQVDQLLRCKKKI